MAPFCKKYCICFNDWLQILLQCICLHCTTSTLENLCLVMWQNCHKWYKFGEPFCWSKIVQNRLHTRRWFAGDNARYSLVNNNHIGILWPTSASFGSDSRCSCCSTTPLPTLWKIISIRIEQDNSTDLPFQESLKITNNVADTNISLQLFVAW